MSATSRNPEIQNQDLLSKLHESFITTYLTLISIIQSSLLAFLVVLVDRDFAALSSDEWFRIASSATIIILVWNEYRMGATQFVWVPSLSDTLIPFFLAFAQIFLIRSIGTDASLWLLALGIFFIFAAIAYCHMYYRASKEGDINAEVLEVIKPYQRLNPSLCGGLGLIYLLCACIVGYIGVPYGRFVVYTTFPIALLFLLRGELNWRRVVRLARDKAASSQ